MARPASPLQESIVGALKHSVTKHCLLWGSAVMCVAQPSLLTTVHCPLHASQPSISLSHTLVVLYTLPLQAVAPHMVRAGSGRIINIGSLTGFTPVPLRGIYSATKAAVMRLSDALRLELGLFGVQVSSGHTMHHQSLIQPKLSLSLG